MTMQDYSIFPTISKAQVDHAANWCVIFTKTFEKELATTGVPYKLIHAEYSKTTNFPIGSKSFGPMLHLCGLERTMRANTVIYIKLQTLD